MSSEDLLTDRDRSVLDAASQPEGAETQDESKDQGEGDRDVETRLLELESAVETLQSENAQLRQHNDDLRDRVNKLEVARDNLWDEIDRLKRRAGDADLSDRPLIDRMTLLVEDGHDELVNGAKRRAVAIHRHWDEWAKELGTNSRQYGISTRMKSSRKYQPMLLKVKLEETLGEDLDANEVHRAMRTLAKESVVDKDEDLEIAVDQAGRKHITGGEYEYHKRTSPDPNDDREYHVVVES